MNGSPSNGSPSTPLDGAADALERRLQLPERGISGGRRQRVAAATCSAGRGPALPPTNALHEGAARDSPVPVTPQQRRFCL